MGLIQPICNIVGAASAATIMARLMSVDVVDASGTESDSVRIQIDAAGLDTWPTTGGVLDVQMGYQSTGVRSLGRFKITSMAESLLPAIITITGTAVPFEKADPTQFKAARSASWQAVTLGNIVQTIAARHGLTPRVHPTLASDFVQHIDQTNEADVQFLTRLAKTYDAVCKVQGAFLIFSLKGQIESMSGRTMAPITVTYTGQTSPTDSDFTNASVSSNDRHKYNGATAYWQNQQQAKRSKVSVGSTPCAYVPGTFVNEASATRAANTRMSKMSREGDKLSLQCQGNPALAAEAALTLASFPSQRMAGQWSIDRVTHTYSRGNGYRCKVEATRPVG